MIRTIAQHKDFVKFVNADHGGHLRGDQWRGGAAAIRLAFADRCTGAMGGDAWQCDSHGDACRRRGRADGHDRSGWPAIFTIDGTYAAAQNQDYSVNTLRPGRPRLQKPSCRLEPVWRRSRPRLPQESPPLSIRSPGLQRQSPRRWGTCPRASYSLAWRLALRACGK